MNPSVEFDSLQSRSAVTFDNDLVGNDFNETSIKTPTTPSNVNLGQLVMSQTKFHKSIQDLSGVNMKMRNYRGEKPFKLNGTTHPQAIKSNVEGVNLLLTAANTMEYVRDSLHFGRWYVVIAGKAVYIDYHMEVVVLYMFQQAAEKGIKTSNPFDEAVRDLQDPTLFDGGALLTKSFFEIIDLNDGLKLYFSLLFENC